MVHNAVIADTHKLSTHQLDAVKKTLEALESSEVEVSNNVKRLLKGVADVMDSDMRHIVRTLELPDAFVQTGVSLLHYVSRMLAFKFPDESIKVTVTQDGNQVRLVLEVSEGQYGDVEEVLESYGRVLLRKQPLSSVLTNKVQLMEWKQKLDISALELRITRDLYNNADGLLSEDVDALEEDVKTLHHLIGNGLRGYFALQHIVSRQEDAGPVKEALSLLQQKLSMKITQDDEEEVKNALSVIVQYEPAVFSEISDAVYGGSLPGKAENYLTSWIASLSGILPR